MSIETVGALTHFEKLEGDGSRTDDFFDARMALVNQGLPTWIPREDDTPERRIYDFFNTGTRQATIEVLEYSIVCYRHELDTPEPISMPKLVDLEQAIRYIEWKCQPTVAISTQP